MWQILFIGGEHLIDHFPDLAEAEDGGRQGVEDDGLIDHIRVAGHCAFDRQFFAAAGDIVQQGELIGHGAHVEGIDPPFGGEDGHFHARAGGKVVDDPGIGDIAVELIGFVIPEDGVEDAGGVFKAPIQVHFFLQSVLADFFPVFRPFSVPVQDVRMFARIPAHTGQTELFDQVRPFPEPRHIFAVVSAGFCHIVVQCQEHFIADQFALVNIFLLCDGFPDQRVGIFPLPLILEVKRLMIDSGAGVGDVIHISADPFCQHVCGPLNGVAETGNLEVGVCFLHPAAQHRHGVGVVQHNGIGAEPVDVGADIQHDGQGAEHPEDTGGTAGITNINIDSVRHGDGNICAEHPVSALKNGDDHPIRPAQRFFPVHGYGQFCRIVPCGEDLFRHPAAEFQFYGVNIHQRQFGVSEGGERHQVPDQSACETETACTDESDLFSHDFFSFCVWIDNAFVLYYTQQNIENQ